MNKTEWLALFDSRVLDLTRIVAHFHPACQNEFEEAIKEKNALKLGECLQTAWENAPDVPLIHEIPGWGVLCDLASEYCFGEEFQGSLNELLSLHDVLERTEKEAEPKINSP